MKLKRPFNSNGSESGIALFMVIAALAVFSIIATEFTYVAQVNQRMASDSLDRVKALYLAKSAYKLSLLRLKAYQHLQALASAGGGAGLGVSRQLIEKVWSFPILYPFPTTVPGLSESDKSSIEAFQKSTQLNGSFTALIESESSKVNLNMVLVPIQQGATAPTGAASASPGATAPTGANQPNINPEAPRQWLTDFLSNIIRHRMESDRDFAERYRDLQIDDLTAEIFHWADRTYETASAREPPVAFKRAPFHSLTELHMLPSMQDEIYDLITPSLTVSATPGINVNTMTETTLRALIPRLEEEEVKEFFAYRDSTEADQSFKTVDEFYAYIKGFSPFGNDSRVNSFKETLAKNNVTLVVDETEFKITVRATVENSTRLLEAWVKLDEGKASKPGEKKGTGLRVTFLRIL